MMAAARTTRPRTSRGRGLEREFRSRPGASNSATEAAATMAMGTASENIDRQPNRPTSTPPMNGPTAALTDVRRSNSPKASPRRSGGAISRMIAVELVETNAPLTAWSTRAPSRTANVGASAASSDANPNPSTPARNVDRCPNRSPSEPATGNATATAAR